MSPVLLALLDLLAIGGIMFGGVLATRSWRSYLVRRKRAEEAEAPCFCFQCETITPAKALLASPEGERCPKCRTLVRP